jgi:hypothetical protein
MLKNVLNVGWWRQIISLPGVPRCLDPALDVTGGQRTHVVHF